MITPIIANQNDEPLGGLILFNAVKDKTISNYSPPMLYYSFVIDEDQLFWNIRPISRTPRERYSFTMNNKDETLFYNVFDAAFRVLKFRIIVWIFFYHMI